MTDLWYIKSNDFLRFETVRCPEIILKFTRISVLKFHYFLLGSLKRRRKTKIGVHLPLVRSKQCASFQ